MSSDTNGDGVADDVKFYKYSAAGVELELDEDSNGDGHVDHRNKFLYDSLGRGAGTLIYNNDDNLVDVRVTSTWSGDVETTAFDFSDDGTVDAKQVYTVDSAGQTLSLKSYDANGNLTSSHELTRDAGERLLSDVYESVSDPTKDSTMTYGYDSSGNWITTDEDDGSDGSIEYHTTVNRDASGLAQSGTLESGAGTLLAKYGYEYDDRARLVKFTQDNGPDGTIDASQTSTYECWK